MEPDIITLNAAISACEKAMQPDKVLKLLTGMLQRGPEPDVIMYSSATSAC